MKLLEACQHVQLLRINNTKQFHIERSPQVVLHVLKRIYGGLCGHNTICWGATVWFDQRGKFDDVWCWKLIYVNFLTSNILIPVFNTCHHGLYTGWVLNSSSFPLHSSNKVWWVSCTKENLKILYFFKYQFFIFRLFWKVWLWKQN